MNVGRSFGVFQSTNRISSATSAMQLRLMAARLQVVAVRVVAAITGTEIIAPPRAWPQQLFPEVEISQAPVE
jgi:hypothetical protein